MRQIKHPLSGLIYEFDEDGNILVHGNGRRGTFDHNGRWLSGDLKSVDPEMCRWIGYGPKEPGDLGENRRYRGAVAIIEEFMMKREQL